MYRNLFLAGVMVFLTAFSASAQPAEAAGGGDSGAAVPLADILASLTPGQRVAFTEIRGASEAAGAAQNRADQLQEDLSRNDGEMVRLRNGLNRPQQPSETPQQFADRQKRETRRFNDLVNKILPALRASLPQAQREAQAAQTHLRETRQRHRNISLPPAANQYLESLARPIARVRFGDRPTQVEAGRAVSNPGGVFDGSVPRAPLGPVANPTGPRDPFPRDATSNPPPQKGISAAAKKRIDDEVFYRNLQRQQDLDSIKREETNIRDAVQAHFRLLVSLKERDRILGDLIREHNNDPRRYKPEWKAFYNGRKVGLNVRQKNLKSAFRMWNEERDRIEARHRAYRQRLEDFNRKWAAMNSFNR
ncbi:MAG: hypothetical protein HYX68_26740 [Planctomycetes bacterium]|nr:hypothetical protein [Planctomycetota bacterium]